MIKNKQTWESYVLSQHVTQGDTLSDELVESWNYSFQNKVNPRTHYGPKQVSPEMLCQLQNKDKELIKIVQHQVAWYQDLLGVSEPLFTLANHQGVIIWSDGEGETIETAYSINFREGSIWTEQTVGTNAIGISLRTKRSIKVQTYEHFAEASHPFSCFSVPIMTIDRQVLGCLNISTKGLFLKSEATCLATEMLVRSIEKECQMVKVVPRGEMLTERTVGLVTENKGYQTFLDQLRLGAQSELPIHIYGETGSGKEIAAKNIHQLSSKKEGPLIIINCGALNQDLLESELFGYVNGAFTGARSSGYEGKIRQANGGTLFLDEVDSMPLSMQVALLRVLEDNIVTPIGSTEGKPSYFRLITATNKNLKDMTKKGLFRQDLFYRIYGLPLTLPPLRERLEDIDLLVAQYCQRKEWAPNWISSVIPFLWRHHWLGNIREFNFFMERLSLFYPIEEPTRKDIEELLALGSLEENRANNHPKANLEKQELKRCLHQKGGNITQAAKEYGVSRSTFYRKLKQHDLSQ